MRPTVVVGYDRTPAGDRALDEAAREAAQRGAALTVFTAYHWPAMVGRQADALRSASKGAEEIAQEGAARAAARYPGLATEAVATEGYAGKVLGRATHGAELLVVGHRGGGGFDSMTVGSTALRALADACCPVLVVRGTTGPVHGRIVAAVDIDEPCEAVLDFAFAEAARNGTRLTVVHVWDEPWILAYGQEDPGVATDVALIEREREDRMTALIEHAGRRWPDVEAFHQIATGSVGAVLVEASHRADLLVTGARRHAEGRHGMLLGPVTQTVLSHAECAVAVVPLT